MIGIVGGMGPYSGTYLANLIFDNTIADKDQDHLPVLLYSVGQIEDRTEYVLKKNSKNPAYKISEAIQKLASIGAKVVAISCNTAYSPEIINVVYDELHKNNVHVELLDPVQETIKFLKTESDLQPLNIGVLSTYGTYLSGIYHKPIKNNGFKLFIPNEKFQMEKIHDCIYNKKYGIKSKSNPVSEKAFSIINEIVDHYITCGVNTIILGCTEFSYAFSFMKTKQIKIIDSLSILAQSLISRIDADKLKKSIIYEKVK